MLSSSTVTPPIIGVKSWQTEPNVLLCQLLQTGRAGQRRCAQRIEVRIFLGWSIEFLFSQKYRIIYSLGFSQKRRCRQPTNQRISTPWGISSFYFKAQDGETRSAERTRLATLKRCVLYCEKKYTRIGEREQVDVSAEVKVLLDIQPIHISRWPVNECMPTFKHDDGKEYLVPEDFKFPTCTILPAFKSWFFTGGSKSKVGRFKNLSGNDIPTKNATLQNARKRWSDWRHVMSYYAQVLDKVPELNWRENFDYKARRIIIREVQKLAPLCKTGTIPTMLSVRTLAAKLRKLQRTQGSAGPAFV